jgi:hypothetical protein
LKEQEASLKKVLKPYFLITIAGLLAFAPVSFMLRALKNDIIALEYPINYYISQCIHNGEIPYWFNTWGMGFPLQSNITWGIFSTPQIIFSSLFDYNIYILHIEFMFFVLLAGWSMFYLLKQYFLKDEKIAQLLAICYMLSGFMVGSTQWLLYITVASFVPLVLSSLLKLLSTPSLKSAFQFAIMYTLMFTSVYAAFNIITTYSLIIFIFTWLGLTKTEKKIKAITFCHILLAGVFTFLLCSPCLFYTFEVLNHIARGSTISSDPIFFSSNYLHPSALSNLVLPFTSVKNIFPNTEGTMLNTYTGIFIILLLPAAIWQAFKEKNKPALIMLGAAVLFLIIAFGDTTPLRNTLNILPGFSYFRNPAIFRFYFILSLILFLGILLRSKSFPELLTLKSNPIAKKIHYTIGLLIIICLVTLIASARSMNNLSFTSISDLIKQLNFNQTVFVSSSIQLAILILLLLVIRSGKLRLANLILVSDIIINTLLCTPFFSVSSYSLKEVNNILNSKKGFPIQQVNVNEVAATHTDSKSNTWNNINVFSKQVSSNDSYRGPLNLLQVQNSDSSNILKDFFNKPIVSFDIPDKTSFAKIIIQKPTHIRTSVSCTEKVTIRLMQNYYPGWKVFYNNKEIPIIKDDNPGISVEVPVGEGIIDFRYERKTLFLFAILLHLTVIIYFLSKITFPFKKKDRSLLKTKV